VDTITDVDNTVGNLDIISMKEDVLPSDITIKRISYDLELSINGTTDKLIVKDYFNQHYKTSSYNSSYDSTNMVNKVEEIRFADGTVWDVNYIINEVKNLRGTEGNDSIYGYEFDEIVNAYGGNDYINTGLGNDTINAGSGNDTINGGTGNDTYIFNLDHGQDVISDYDTTTGNIDTIDLQANPLELIFQRSSNNLVLSQAEAPDQITIQSWYSGSAYQIEQIKATDGSVLLNTQIEQLIQAMASFSQDTGMDWEQAIQDNQEAVSNILAQFWTAQA